MIVGEQPGDQGGPVGRPFVGPAGRVLDEALSLASLDRRQLYVTNAVKHFKYEPRGKRRIHQRPNINEVEQCRWWLTQEINIVQPKLIVAMGTTALFALTGQKDRLEDVRAVDRLPWTKPNTLCDRPSLISVAYTGRAGPQRCACSFPQGH